MIFRYPLSLFRHSPVIACSCLQLSGLISQPREDKLKRRWAAAVVLGCRDHPDPMYLCFASGAGSLNPHFLGPRTRRINGRIHNKFYD
jgi:hypothetical protein